MEKKTRISFSLRYAYALQWALAQDDQSDIPCNMQFLTTYLQVKCSQHICPWLSSHIFFWIILYLLVLLIMSTIDCFLYLQKIAHCRSNLSDMISL
jgi:hypothetical protein